MASHLSESQSIGVPFGSCLPESVFRAFLENAFYLGGSAPKLDCSRAGLDLQFFFESISSSRRQQDLSTSRALSFTCVRHHALLHQDLNKSCQFRIMEVQEARPNSRERRWVSTKLLHFEENRWSSVQIQVLLEGSKKIDENVIKSSKFKELRRKFMDI